MQPPDDSNADQFRDELDDLLSEATAGLADLRIAARRDEPTVLDRVAGELVSTTDALEDWANRYVIDPIPGSDHESE